MGKGGKGGRSKGRDGRGMEKGKGWSEGKLNVVTLWVKAFVTITVTGVGVQTLP